MGQRLFCERGYAAANVDAIVGELGVTPPVLYHHFGSKDGLLRAIVEPLVGELDDLVARAPQLSAGTEGRRALLQAYLEVLTRCRPVVCFLIDDPAVRHHPDIGGRLAHQQSQLQSALAGTDTGSTSPVAAAAALGAVWRPVTALDEDQLAQYAEVIVDAGVAAYDAASP